MPMLRHFHYRHGVAESSHGFERRRLESKDDQSIAVEVRPEHHINIWIASLSDAVVLALIRENPHWLRNAAVADRLCAWRQDLARGDRRKAEARALLKQLAEPTAPAARRGARPYSRVAAEARREVIDSIEADARKIRSEWLHIRANNPEAELAALGALFLRRLNGWAAPDPSIYSPESKVARGATLDPQWDEPQLLWRLAEQLLIVKDRDNKNYVVIDEGTWPRSRALALVSERWRVSKRWLREGLGQQ